MNKEMDNDRELWQSQNFLKRPEFVAQLVRLANIKSDDLVVEIGPGKGIITRQLVNVAGKVIAIEADPRLAENLKREFVDKEKVTILNSDFFDWSAPKSNYKIFSNIPFNLTTDVIKRVTEGSRLPIAVFLIMQDKAFERFAGTYKESQMSLLLKPWFEFKKLRNIDRNEYTPVPNVNTLLVEIQKRETPLVDESDKQEYRDFIIYGFNQWKPTVLESFSGIFSTKQRKIIEKNIKIKGLKPSEVTLEQWVELFRTYLIHVPESKKQEVRGTEKQFEKKHKKHTKLHRTR